MCGSVPNRLTSRDVVRFYKRRLPGWHSATWLVDGTSFACFKRDGALVSIQPDGMDPRGSLGQKSYGVLVDHDGGDCN